LTPRLVSGGRDAIALLAGAKIAEHYAFVHSRMEKEMRIRTATLTAAVSCSLLLSSGLMAQTTGTAPRSAAPSNMPTNGTKDTSQLARADRTFLENAAQGGHAEIEGSKLAEQKASSPDVKTFAARMIKDHTAVGEELTKLASTKGYTPPTEPSVVQRTELKALSALDGERFDKMYSSRIGVAAHESTVKMFKEAAQRAQDPDIKAFAAKHVPDLEHHLQMARDLNKKVGNDK
jgi:putative membrane protein